MNTLEQLGIQSWKLRNDRQDLGAPSADQAKIEVIEREVSNSRVEPAAFESSEPKLTSEAAIVPVVTKPEDAVIAGSMIELEGTLEGTIASENQLAQADSRGVASLANADWQGLADIFVGDSFCQSCARTSPVLGDGNLQAKWVFVFDAPSAKDVSHQKLLSGRVGQLFDAILDAVGLNRESIYLTSVFKCPPSQDLSLAAQCGDLVHRQLQLIKPKVVVTLGEFASQTVLRANEDLVQLRSAGLRNINDDTLVAPTYGLSEMLESPEFKASVWQDLKKCLALS